MATFSYKNAYLAIGSASGVGGTALSAWVRSLTLNYEAESLEDTAMGDTFRSRLAGLKDWSVDVEFT